MLLQHNASMVLSLMSKKQPVAGDGVLARWMRDMWPPLYAGGGTGQASVEVRRQDELPIWMAAKRADRRGP